MRNMPDSVLISFSAYKMLSAKCVWSVNDDDSYRENLVHQYAIGNPASNCFRDVDFIADQPIECKAERYGGFGGAPNGGGSRCANIGNKQVKGVGPNVLVGEGVDEWYSNGALNIVDAVCEVVYSDVLNRVMPLGAVRCYGVLSTGKKTAFYTESLKQESVYPCLGAMVVRDTCLRPAHFLRARGYKVPEALRAQVCSDVARTRRAAKDLKKLCGGSAGLAPFLGKLAANYANQFAFALVARITHGAATPSNFSMDGRWLDLTTVSFLDGVKNYRISGEQASFLEEHEVTLDILLELTHTYAKYNRVTVNASVLLAYYKEAIEYYFHKHCCYIIGVPEDIWLDMGENYDSDNFCKLIRKILFGAGREISGSPKKLNSNDSFLELIRVLYLSLKNPDEAVSKISSDLLSSEDATEIIRSFRGVVSRFQVSRSCVVSWLLLSLKRVYCSEYFYRGRLRDELGRMVEDSNVAEFSEWISKSIKYAEWAFQDIPGGDRVVLFKSENVEIGYSVGSCIYYLDKNNLERVEYSSYRYLADLIKKIGREEFSVNGFSCYEYLIALERDLEMTDEIAISEREIVA